MGQGLATLHPWLVPCGWAQELPGGMCALRAQHRVADISWSELGA
jgi:hypothetical protein